MPDDDRWDLPARNTSRHRGGSAPRPPAGWVRVQTYVCESGWPAVVAMAGGLADPARLARAEAAELEAAGVDVRADGTGHPCVDPADPAVTRWAAELGEAVTRASDRIEAALAEALRG
jgi:hypothetical protein